MTKSTVFSRSFVSVKDEAPTSYLPAASPGMMLSKVAFLTSTLRPMTAPSAFIRSASIPTTVWPSDAMNSSGAYVASAATVSVPFDLIADGTSAATVASAPLDPELEALLELVLDVPAEPEVDELLLLLLPQPTDERRGSTPRRPRRSSSSE